MVSTGIESGTNSASCVALKWSMWVWLCLWK